MYEDGIVLCASSAYTKQFYLNPEFESLPESIREELKIMCVLYTEDVGGTLVLRFDEEGNLNFETDANEEELLYDEKENGENWTGRPAHFLKNAGQRAEDQADPGAEGGFFRIPGNVL